MRRRGSGSRQCLSLALLSALCACGDGPPSALAREKVERAVHGFEGDLQCGVESIDVGSFSKRDAMGLVFWEATWSAKLRVDEPIAALLDRVGGTNVVAIVAKAGDRLAYGGKLVGGKLGDQWNLDANTEQSGLEGLLDTARKLRDDYPGGAGSDGSVPQIGRASVRALSKMGECVEAGTDAEKQLRQQAVARLVAQQEARQRQLEAQRAAAAEKQRQEQEARAEAQRQAEAAAAARAQKAKDDADQRAEQARLARLMPLLAPFQGELGAVIVGNLPEESSAVVLRSSVDVEAKTVSGSGIDLRSMPPREFTFEATANDTGRGSLSFKWTLDEQPKVFVAGANGSLVMPRNLTLKPFDADARARFERLIASARALSAASPLELAVENLDAAQCKAREASFEVAAIEGSVVFRNGPYPAGQAIFGGSLLGKRPSSWSRESMAIRLNQPTRARALFVKGANVATDNLLLVINGVHRVSIALIPAEGGAIVSLPADLEVLDLRFDAIGRISTRGIVFLR